MTADRWWVQAAARWLARVDGVSGQIRLAMLIMTGLSTATLTLRSYGHGRYAWPLIGATALGGAVYTYLYTEGGVWNQMQRDKADLSSNWASPPSRFNTEITARTYAAAQLGRPLKEEEREAVAEECDRAWMKYRDGVDIEAIEERTGQE